MTKSRVFDTAWAGALVETLGSCRGNRSAHFRLVICIVTLCFSLESPTASNAQPVSDESAPAPASRQRMWNRSASKGHADFDLLLRIETIEGVLLVYPAATPKDEFRRNRPYLAYWNDLLDSKLYVYGRDLLAEGDVGEAMEALEQQLGIDIDLFAKEYPPLVDSGMWVFGSLPTAAWLVATRSSVLDVMGLPFVPPENPEDSPILPILNGGCPMCSGVQPEPVWDASADVVLAEISKAVCSCCPWVVGCGNCDDGDECTRDRCEITGCEVTCVHRSINCDEDPCASCRAGDNCTFRWCDDGACFEEPRDCDDGNECTNDSCSLTEACVNAPRSGSCTDDGNVCTDDICDNGQCTHPAKDGGSCPGFDSNPCLNGICANGNCVADPLTGPSCLDDADPCTDDVCDDGLCTHPDNDGISCDAYDSSPCIDGICFGGTCLPHYLTGPSCASDGDACTDDVCDDGWCTHLCSTACSCGVECCAAVEVCCGAGGCCDPANCCGGLDCCLAGQECCGNGECCNIACEGCIDNGSITGGTISVAPPSGTVCPGDTITFTLAGAQDIGGIKRVACSSKMLVPGGTLSYTWTITKPDTTTVTGSGSIASVAAIIPGEYSCEFVASSNRNECPPPEATIDSPVVMVNVSATLSLSPSSISASTEWGSMPDYNYSQITVQWSPTGCQGTLEIAELEAMDGYLPPDQGSLFQTADDTWQYWAYDEPQTELCTKSVKVWIAAKVGAVELTRKSILVWPVHTWWTNGHQHGPNGQTHPPDVSDFTNDYHFLRWKYAAVLATTGGAFATGGVTISPDTCVLCPDWNPFADCVYACITNGNVVFGTDTFRGSENQAASIIGHELLHTTDAGECPAYRWEAEHCDGTAVCPCDAGVDEYLDTVLQYLTDPEHDCP